MEILFAFLFIVVLIAITKIVGSVPSQRNVRIGRSSAKFPPPFSSSLSRKEILKAVEERVTTMQSIRQKWKTTDKVEKIGRYQAMLNVPFNVAGDNVQVAYLLNLLATSRDAGGCMVEWNYVAMSELSDSAPQLAVLENEIFKNTTLEIRSALFIAQGDAEEADFLISKTERQHIESPSAREHMKRSVDLGKPSPASGPYSPNRAKVPAKAEKPPAQEPATILDNPSPALPDIVEAELHSLGKPDTDLGKTPMHVAKSIPGTALPDLTTEELNSIGNTAGAPSLMQIPEVQAQMPVVNLPTPDVSSQMPESNVVVPAMELKLGEVPNTLNFSPPDPTLSASTSASKDSKCVKCNQDRDPSFNFCLYCGHSDA